MTRFRKREDVFDANNGIMKFYRRVIGTENWLLYANAPGSPFLRSFASYCNDELHSGPPYKSGGLFLLNSARYPVGYQGNSTYKLRVGAYEYEAKGGFSLNPLVLTGVSPLPIGTTSGTLQGNTASQYGATGWNRFRPGKPQHSLGQAVLEARSIPSMLKGSAKTLHEFWKSIGGKRHIKDTSKATANEFLNNQFGWNPFLSDMKSLYQLCQLADKDALQIKRDNNKWVRRSGTIPVGTDNQAVLCSSTSSPAVQPNGLAYYPFVTGPPYGSFTALQSDMTKCWFVGMFKYYIPVLDGPNWYWPAMLRAYGLSLTPTLIYELTPWSWLIDWFSNTGDIISNWEAASFDNLVAKYAYVMMSRSRKIEITSIIKFAGSNLTHNFAYEWNYKNRSLAQPYSFGWDVTSLSAWQAAILTALGVSRLR